MTITAPTPPTAPVICPTMAAGSFDFGATVNIPRAIGALCAPLSRGGQIVCSRSVGHCGLRRLHHRSDDKRADLLPHLPTRDGRKAVVKAGADPGVGDLIAESPKVGELMRDPG